jgi:hypothetical protein
MMTKIACCMPRWLGCLSLLVSVSACSGSRDPATPEAAHQRGEELLRQGNDALKAATAFSFDTDEVHDRVLRNGEKRTYSLQRSILVRRPDRLRSHLTGGEDQRDFIVTYDGKHITLVGNHQKVWAQIDAPPTLDAALDLVQDRYNVPIPVADFLYSSPIDSFEDSKATGGWVRRETINNQVCDVLDYKMEAVDFTLWVADEAPSLPCRIHLTYKTRPGKPTSQLTFKNWNLKAAPAESEFVASIPQGYEHIPVVERIPKSELKADPAKAMGATSPNPQD